jgi:lipoprotein-anchoring transpeptidase ErfK/SrfK
MRALRLAAAIAVSCAAALAWSGAAGAAPLPATAAGVRDAVAPAPPSARLAWVGRVLAPVTARSAPRRSARAKTVLQPLAPIGKGPTVLLITRSLVRDGQRWVEVLLPIRPNGSRGWVPADVLRMRTTPMRILIDVGDRRLTLFRAGRAVMRVPVAVGVPATPTPLGNDFAIAERIPTNTPGAFLGPIVMPLTGYSEQLNEFAGGNGRVAIHGTSLPQLIGTAVSHGCIRLYNSDITRLARLARAGTPVSIRN